MTELPHGLINIEEVTEEIERIHSPFTGTENFATIVSFSPFRPEPWYSTTLSFYGQNFSPPCIPFYSPERTMLEIPIGSEPIYSSMFTSSLESLLYGGPTVPRGY